MAWIGLIFPYSPRFMDINEFGITACRKDQERIYVKQILLNVYLFRKDYCVLSGYSSCAWMPSSVGFSW